MTSVPRVLGICCRYYNVHRDDLLSRSLKAELVLPRKIAYWLAREVTNMSWLQIGYRMGGRDNTTARTGARSIERAREQDPALKMETNELRRVAASDVGLDAALRELTGERRADKGYAAYARRHKRPPYAYKSQADHQYMRRISA